MQKKFKLFDFKYLQQSKKILFVSTIGPILYFLADFIQDLEISASANMAIFFLSFSLSICTLFSFFFLQENHRNILFNMVNFFFNLN